MTRRRGDEGVLGEETLVRIRQVEKGLARIALRIRELEDQRAQVLMFDPEYAEYVQSYQRYFYGGEPLSIRQYYERKVKIDEIDAQFVNYSGDDFEQIWEKYWERTVALNRLF